MLSVALVAVNKIIMNTYGFSFVLVLSSCHFVATAFLLEVISRRHYFGVTKKVMPVVDNLTMSAVGALSIILMNLSLKTASPIRRTSQEPDFGP